MTTSTTIHLHIGNAVPHGNARHSKDAIALWRDIAGCFDKREFTAQAGAHLPLRTCQVSLDAAPLLEVLENAVKESGSFDAHRQAHVKDEAKAVAAALSITLVSREAQREEEAYQGATVFLQQLVLAANIALPGSMQILDARFTGGGAHRYEAQNFDARIFHAALDTARSNHWPALQTLPFDAVWNWLETRETAATHTAIKGINKVLFTQLKVAEQRHEYSARTALLVLYQLEMLLDTHNAASFKPARNRARLILGDIPESADCFKKLHDVKNSLFLGDHPVHRPPLICHDTGKELKEQIGRHNTAVVLGTTLVLALLQDLVEHGAQGYAFTEGFVRMR